MKCFICWLLLLFFCGPLSCRQAAQFAPTAVSPTLVESANVGGSAVAIPATLISSGLERHYRLYVPASYADVPVPLLVNIHGFGGSAAQQEETSQTSKLADSEGFIVVYPEGLGTQQQGWQIHPASEDVTFIRDLVAELQAQYHIDRRRVYATGLSNGGGMVNRLACDAADLFAAVAPVNGAYTFHTECRPVQPVSIIIFHGLDDPIVPYDGSFQTPPIAEWAMTWAERNGCISLPEVSTTAAGDVVARWIDCPQGTTTVLYSTQGAGHTWPSSARVPDTIDATKVIWAFFQDHPFRDGPSY